MTSRAVIPGFLSALLSSSAYVAAQALVPPEPFEPANTGSAGYLPPFHPAALTEEEVTTARLAALARTPSPANIVLEFPESYTARVACLGRAFDPRGPFAHPPRAPFLIPDNISGLAFGDDLELTPAAERFFPFTMGFNRAQRNIPGNPPLQTDEKGSRGGLIVRGTIPCNGSVLSVNPSVSILPNGDNPSLKVIGIGFRNPFSLGIAPLSVPSIGGTLLVANNSSDVRGQRPIANTAADLWPLNALGLPVLNWGWPNEHNYFVPADPQFGLPDNALDASDTDVFTGDLPRRAANQPPQALAGQARLFHYLTAPGGKLLRNGEPVRELVDPDFLAGIGLVSVDTSALGFDFSTSSEFGLANNMFMATGGNLGFPMGAVPQDRMGKDIRRIRIVAPFTRFYGAVPTVFAKNASQPGGAAGANTGGFIRPIDVKFNPSGETLFMADFGAGITIDTGQVGGSRKDNPGEEPGAFGAIRFEQVAGTSAIWTFKRTGPAPGVGPR